MSQSKYVFKIYLPGHVLACWFKQRESEGKDLLLNLSQGPYAMAQLMAHVSVVMKDSRKRSMKYLKDTTSDVMRTDKVDSTTPPTPPANPPPSPPATTPRRRPHPHSLSSAVASLCAGEGDQRGHCALRP